MPISDWFSARESNRYTKVTEPLAGGSGDVAVGVWVKCDNCGKTIYGGQLAENDRVCPLCGFHFNLTAEQRIDLLADEGSFTELDADLGPCDPLEWEANKRYVDQLASAGEKSGLPEAIVTGRATLEGHPLVLGAMDFRFIGASMGSVVGEKIARAFEFAIAEGLPVVLVTASGGARMQEGMLSLMQMAKTSAALAKLHEARIPYISVLTDPTTGGVSASIAMLGDVIIAEPKAMIGFAGPRVIKETIRAELPEGFQRAEYLFEHGMVDLIVERRDLQNTLASLLEMLKTES